MNKIADKKIGFIGAGKMGGAIIKGVLDSGFLTKENIVISENSEHTAKIASEILGLPVDTDNNALVRNSDIIFLCTKPFVLRDVISGIKTELTGDKLLVSIAAGISTETIESAAGVEIPVIRVMPNTPALVGEGMTAVCKGKYADSEHINLVMDIFSQIGRCVEVPEKLIDAVTGISGSGPAFFYLMIEAMADGGVKLGIPKATALELAAQTALGAAKMILETGKHPSVLKDEVTTPGGCTAAGLSVMEEQKIRAGLIRTVEETARVAKGLG